tara:strand:- start:14067 stop:17270 length:3204 start_codon:yes stop_codon:yes gene_type:complete
MTNATSTQLQELYVAYFGRAADPTGLDYWTEKGITSAKFASDMYAQAEFKDAYGSLSTESQVNQIYKNLFDREADVTGLTYWTQQINLGNLQLAEIATHLIWAAKNNDGSADDKTALTNRTNAAVAYTAEVKLTTAGILAYQAETTSPWKSGVNITEAISYLSGIDKDTAYTASGITTSVNTIKTNGVPTSSSSFNLTAATAGDDLVGTSGNDTFTGGSAARFQSADTVTGGAGTDTLNTKITGTITPTVDEIENIILDATGTASIDGANIGTDTTSVTVKGGNTVTYLNAVQETFTVSEASTGLTVTAKTGFTNSNSDAITVNLGAAAFGTITLGDEAESSYGYEYETVNLVLSGDGSATLAEADGETSGTPGWITTSDTINITGTGDFELNLADAQIGGNATLGSEVAVKIVASDHTGKLTVDLGVLETENVSAANWTGVDAIKIQTDDTGDTENQLVDVASGTEVIIAGVESVDNVLTIDPNGSATGETLQVTLNNATAGSSVDIDSLTTDGFETLTIHSTGTDSSTVTVKNIVDVVAGTTNDPTLKITGDKHLTLGAPSGATDFVEATFTSITSTNTAGVDIAIAAGGALSFTGGSGNDRLVVNTIADITSADSLNGGDGTDTLAITAEVLTDFSTAQLAVLSNFEILEYYGAQDIDNGNTSPVIDLTAITGMNEVFIDGAITSSNTDTLTVKGESGMTFRTDASMADTNGLASQLIIDVKDAANAGTNDTVNFHSDVASGGTTARFAFQIDNVENLNVNVSGVFQASDVQTIADVDGAQLTTITVTSDAGSTSGTANIAESLTISGIESTLLSTFDASAFEGAVDVTGLATNYIATGATIKGGTRVDKITAGTGADTITGGAGADTLLGGNSNDNIDGGAGADKIEGEAGADTITGGTGKDTYVLDDDHSTESAMDIIKDFAALATDADFDTLNPATGANVSKDESSAVDVKAGTADTADTSVTATVSAGVITLGGTEKANVNTLAEWIDVAEILLARNVINDNSTEAGMIAFEFSGDTYVVYGDDASSEATYATEGAVKLEGLTGITGISTTEAINTIHIA